MRLDMRMDMHAQYSLMHARYSRTTCSRMQPRRAGSAEQADLECAVRAVVVVECCRQLTHLQAFWALELAWPSRSCCRPSPGQFWPMDCREPNRYTRVQGQVLTCKDTPIIAHPSDRPTDPPTDRPHARLHAHTHLHDREYALGSQGSRTLASLPAACRLLPSGRRSWASRSSTGLREHIANAVV